MITFSFDNTDIVVEASLFADSALIATEKVTPSSITEQPDLNPLFSVL